MPLKCVKNWHYNEVLQCSRDDRLDYISRSLDVIKHDSFSFFYLISLYLYRPPKLSLHHDCWWWAIRPEELDIGGCLLDPGSHMWWGMATTALWCFLATTGLSIKTMKTQDLVWGHCEIVEDHCNQHCPLPHSDGWPQSVPNLNQILHHSLHYLDISCRWYKWIM